ncbi:MAG: sigma-70 family RNA polymerase sigma factor [Dehalococcoidia bacterium]|nr:sigma-70 family RNA polymerase sigma factor [Dehalococcoidia bacterium]
MAEPKLLESDEWWVERALDEPKAFEELVYRYQDRLYNLACRLTGDREEAQDLTQEALVRAYAGLKTFRKGERFSPWVYKITANLCISYLRRRKPRVQLDEEAPFVDGSLSPEQALEKKEIRDTVQRAILALPEQYRAVILLRHQQDLPYADIAKTLGLPIGTVKTHLFRAREMLHKILSREIDVDGFSKVNGGGSSND